MQPGQKEQHASSSTQPLRERKGMTMTAFRLANLKQAFLADDNEAGDSPAHSFQWESTPQLAASVEISPDFTADHDVPQIDRLSTSDSPNSRDWHLQLEAITEAISRRYKRVVTCRTRSNAFHTEWQYRLSNYQQQRQYLRESAQAVLTNANKSRRSKSSMKNGIGRAELYDQLQSDCTIVDDQEHKMQDIETQLLANDLSLSELEGSLQNAVETLISLLGSCRYSSAGTRAATMALEPSLDSQDETSHDSLDPVLPEVRAYYSRVGDVSVIRERIAELQFDHQEEQRRREFLAEQDHTFDITDEEFSHRHSVALRALEDDLQSAMDLANVARETCRDQGIPVPDFDLNGATMDIADIEPVELPPPDVHTTHANLGQRLGTFPSVATEPVGLRVKPLETAQAQDAQSLDRIQDWIYSLREEDAMPSTGYLASELTSGMVRSYSVRSLPTFGSSQATLPPGTDKEQLPVALNKRRGGHMRGVSAKNPSSAPLTPNNSALAIHKDSTGMSRPIATKANSAPSTPMPSSVPLPHLPHLDLQLPAGQITISPKMPTAAHADESFPPNLHEFDSLSVRHGFLSPEPGGARRISATSATSARPSPSSEFPPHSLHHLSEVNTPATSIANFSGLMVRNPNPVQTAAPKSNTDKREVA